MIETIRSRQMKDSLEPQTLAKLHSIPEYHHHTVASLSAVSSRTMPVHVALAFVRHAPRTSHPVTHLHLVRLTAQSQIRPHPAA